MLIAVLSLGGAILAATTIAGLLMLYQLRASTDSESSAKAVFAADSGVEWSLYSYFTQLNISTTTLGGSNATYQVTCYNNAAVPQVVACDGSNGTTTLAVSRGAALDTARAFYVNFGSASTTYP